MGTLLTSTLAIQRNVILWYTNLFCPYFCDKLQFWMLVHHPLLFFCYTVLLCFDYHPTPSKMQFLVVVKNMNDAMICNRQSDLKPLCHTWIEPDFDGSKNKQSFTVTTDGVEWRFMCIIWVGAVTQSASNISMDFIFDLHATTNKFVCEKPPNWNCFHTPAAQKKNTEMSERTRGCTLAAPRRGR